MANDFKNFFELLIGEFRNNSVVYPYYFMQSSDSLKSYADLDEATDDIFYIYNFETDEIERGEEIEEVFSDSQLMLKTYKTGDIFILHFDYSIKEIIDQQKKIRKDYLLYIVKSIMCFFNKIRIVRICHFVFYTFDRNGLTFEYSIVDSLEEIKKVFNITWKELFSDWEKKQQGF